MGLVRYQARRDFSRTGEPKGGKARRSTGKPRFLVQKHAATRLHYDFRLEMDGVLKSWAVPKGIPVEQGEKRLAMQVEDHPLEYGSFEGIIPPGNYGAGTVMLWDTGAFESLDGGAVAALGRGKIELLLAGKKLKGHWTLVRMRRTEEGSGNAWLLIKTGESRSALSARADDRSVTSGRTMARIAADPASVWKPRSKTTSAPRNRSWPRATPKQKRR